MSARSAPSGAPEASGASAAVLLVLGEPGTDVPVALSIPGTFAARLYVPHGGEGPGEAGAGTRRGGGRARPSALAMVPGAPPGGVTLFDAPSEAAIARARAAHPENPIVVLGAGEWLDGAAGAGTEGGETTLASAGARRSVGRSARPAAPIPTTIRIAGGSVRHVPWFHGRRAALYAAAGEARARASLSALREPGDLADVTRALFAEALAARLPSGRVGAFRLVAGPWWRSLRVLASGGWRDGVRGVLMSLLHGLHALIILARAWQAAEGEPSRPGRGRSPEGAA